MPSVVVSGHAVVLSWPPTFQDALPPGPWIVAHCRPKQERRLAEEMQRRGLPGLAFFERRFRRYAGHGTQEGLVPLLGGYVFFQASFEQRYTLWETGRIVNLINAPKPEIVTAELSALIKMIACSQGPVVVRPELVPGTPIQITHGTFAGCTGIVIRRANATELVVNVQLLGHAVSVQLPAGSLDRKSD